MLLALHGAPVSVMAGDHDNPDGNQPVITSAGFASQWQCIAQSGLPWRCRKEPDGEYRYPLSKVNIPAPVTDALSDTAAVTNTDIAQLTGTDDTATQPSRTEVSLVLKELKSEIPSLARASTLLASDEENAPSVQPVSSAPGEKPAAMRPGETVPVAKDTPEQRKPGADAALPEGHPASAGSEDEAGPDGKPEPGDKSEPGHEKSTEDTAPASSADEEILQTSVSEFDRLLHETLQTERAANHDAGQAQQSGKNTLPVKTEQAPGRVVVPENHTGKHNPHNIVP